MSAPLATTVITYGAWITSETGFRLHDAHEISEDADRVVVDFTVIVSATTEPTLLTYVASMTDELYKENQRLKVSINGTLTHDLTGTLANVSGSSPAAAQQVKATWDLLGTHRTSISRAYRVRIEALKPANQAGKTAKRAQRIELSTTPGGLKGLSVEVDFTVGTDGSTAREMSEDATHGFDARVTAIKSALASGAVWEESGRSTTSDEDDRTVTVSAFYRELPFAQSASATDDTTLANVVYSSRVVRKPARAGAEFGPAVQLAELSVNFSAQLVYSGSALNPDAVIRDTVLPYVTGTIAPRATVAGSQVLMGHTLRFTDLPVPAVSGSVFYLVPEGTLLAGSAITREQYRRGVSYASVLDGKEFTVDEHVGPGLKAAQVVVATEELGSGNPEMLRVAKSLADGMRARGYEPLGDAFQSESVRRAFTSPFDSLGTIVTSISYLIQDFRYVEIRGKRARTRIRGGRSSRTRR